MKNPFKKELSVLVYECQVNPQGYDRNTKHGDDLDTFRLLDSLLTRICLHRIEESPYSRFASNTIEYALPADVKLTLSDTPLGWKHDEQKSYEYVGAIVEIRTLDKNIPDYIKNILSIAGIPLLEKERHYTLSEFMDFQPDFFRMRQNKRGE